jgi:type III secretory pathway component EscR
MKRSDKIFSFLVKKYSLILIFLFLIAIILSGFIYFSFNKKINQEVFFEEKNEVNVKKIQEILNKVSKKEQDYQQSLQKNYRDIFK